jgi:DNA-directed RNA polymerase subunit B'
MADIFFNGALAGTTQDAKKFVADVIEARRAGKLPAQLNAGYVPEQDIAQLFLEKDRLRRALIVVKEGKSLLTPEITGKLKAGELKWSDLVKSGIIEYLDAAEEENTLIAVDEESLTPKHTHLEINPAAIFGICTSMVPFANFEPSSRISLGQKVQRQTMGCYALNFLNRTETAINLLHYPQRPIVRSFTQEIYREEYSAGQNIIIAVMNYEGFNMEDALVINRASLDRGFGRSSTYRPYPAERHKYPGGQVDEIVIPTKDVDGYTLEHDYRLLAEDGMVCPETDVLGGDVVIGRTSPPRFLGKVEAFSTAANIRKDTSARLRHGEQGTVSKVIITEDENGDLLVKVDVRDSRRPEIGDKFSSRHGQKGICGLIANPEDLPFTADGITPDIIFSPTGLIDRMTVSHLIEMLGGKVGALAARYVDATPFLSEKVEDLREELLRLGFRENGTETLYNGKTGRQYTARIYTGNIFYLRLKYQVVDKIQARARGPVTLLTRQPTEGRAKEGGLRLGEMEKECLVAHGASLLMKERFDSDKVVMHVCERCGGMAIYDAYRNKATCLCGEKTRIHPVEMSYAFKLFLDELKSLHIKPKLVLGDRY